MRYSHAVLPPSTAKQSMFMFVLIQNSLRALHACIQLIATTLHAVPNEHFSALLPCACTSLYPKKYGLAQPYIFLRHVAFDVESVQFTQAKTLVPASCYPKQRCCRVAYCVFLCDGWVMHMSSSQGTKSKHESSVSAVPMQPIVQHHGTQSSSRRARTCASPQSSTQKVGIASVGSNVLHH